MRTPEMLRSGLRVLATVVVIAVPASAVAHTVLMTPPPRDVGVAGNDAHKNGPCGAVPRTTTCTSYEAGATIPVKWMETVSHQGCFQVALSTGNDQNFTVLKQINDPAGGAAMVYPDTVKLPDGVTCKDCTLVVRQLMIGKTCVGGGGTGTTGPFQNDLDASTYYSCADIRIGDPTPCSAPIVPDGGDEDASTEEDGGTPVPTDGGGTIVDGGGGTGPGSNARPNLSSGEGGGCSVALGATSGVSLGITAGLLGLALVRRRRRRG